MEIKEMFGGKQVSNKITIQNAINVAKKKGGICLSKKYVRARDKLEWECASGHKWWASYDSVSRLSWCPECYYMEKIKRTKYDILKICSNTNKMIKGFDNLSERLILKDRVDIVCDNGHITNVAVRSIVDKRACKECMKNGLDDASMLAKKRNGKCISTKYINSGEHLLWECQYNHQWPATYDNIKSGYWCPMCAGNAKNTIEDAIEIAEERDGKCLSKKYINVHGKLKWKCSKGHVWHAEYGSVCLSGTWCPVCRESRGERDLYITLKKIFNDKHDVIHRYYNDFDWLLNKKTKRRQHLDFFVETRYFTIGIEYDGEHHFNPVRFGGISDKDAKDAFKIVKKNDRRKNKLIKNNKNDVSYFIRFGYKDEVSNIDFVISKINKEMGK